MIEYKQYAPANHFHATWGLSAARLEYWMDLANVLSATPTQTSIHFHYVAGAIPPLVMGAVLGTAALTRRFPTRTGLVVTAVVAVALASAVQVVAALRARGHEVAVVDTARGYIPEAEEASALAGTVGCVVGSIPAYYLGLYGGRPLVERWGRYILVSHRDLDLADRLFQRFGQWVVFAGRLLPIVRTFIAFPAGVSRMPMGKFVVYTFVGSYPWCLGLAWVGAKLGEQWHTDPRLKAAFHRFDALIGVAIALAAAWFVWHKVREARRARAVQASEAKLPASAAGQRNPPPRGRKSNLTGFQLQVKKGENPHGKYLEIAIQVV